MMKNPSFRQKFAFGVLFLMGANLLIGSGYRAEQDSWISMATAAVTLVLWAVILARISFLCPGQDIFCLLQVFPKWIRRLLIAVVTVYCFGQAVITVRVYAGFVHIVSLPNTNIIILLALTCLSIAFFLGREDGLLYRFSYVSAIPIVLITLMLFVFLSPMFRGESLYPILYQNTGDVLYCYAENLSFPFGNAFLLLGLSLSPGDSKKERFSWVLMALFAGVLSVIIVLQNILLLGGELVNDLDFPYNFAASLVNVGDFFSRIEVFSSLFFFLSAIVRSAYFMKLVSRGIRSTVPSKPQAMALPLSALLCGYAAIAFENTNTVFNYLEIFPFIALPLQFGLPLILWICLEVRLKNKTGYQSILRMF